MYTKWLQYIPTSSITRPSKIYPKWDFWFENRPSGNPGDLRSLCFETDCLIHDQGDQIGRIFAQRAILYFG
jgi:hypothetical protein